MDASAFSVGGPNHAHRLTAPTDWRHEREAVFGLACWDGARFFTKLDAETDRKKRNVRRSAIAGLRQAIEDDASGRGIHIDLYAGDLAHGVMVDLDNGAALIGHETEPTFYTQTSENGRQAVWLFEEPIARRKAMALARALAKAHGGDAGAITTSQSFRVPGTWNWKKAVAFKTRPISLGDTTTAERLATEYGVDLDAPVLSGKNAIQTAEVSEKRIEKICSEVRNFFIPAFARCNGTLTAVSKYGQFKLNLAETKSWLKITISIVVTIGNAEAAAEIVDELSAGRYLPEAARAAVRSVYNRVNNLRYLKRILSPEDFFDLYGKEPVTERTYKAILTSAKRKLGVHSTQRKMAAVNSVAKIAKRAPDAVYQTHMAKIEELGYRGAKRRIAERIVELGRANGGEAPILTPSMKATWAAEEGVRPHTLQTYLSGYTKDGLFQVVGGHHHRDGDTVVGWASLRSEEDSISAKCGASLEEVSSFTPEEFPEEQHEDPEGDWNPYIGEINSAVDPDDLESFLKALVLDNCRDLAALARLELFEGGLQKALWAIVDRAEARGESADTGPNRRLMQAMAELAAQGYGPFMTILQNVMCCSRGNAESPADRRDALFEAICAAIQWTAPPESEVLAYWRKKTRMAAFRRQKLADERRLAAIKAQADARIAERQEIAARFQARRAYLAARDPDAVYELDADFQAYAARNEIEMPTSFN